MNRLFPVVLLTLLPWFGAGIAGCGSNGKKDKDPRERLRDQIRTTFEKFRTAGQENDYRAMYEVVSYESRKRLIFEAILAMGSGAGSKESEQILAKHVNQETLKKVAATLKKPTQDQVMDMYMISIADPKTMFIESYEYLQRFDPNRKNPVFGELGEIEIVGEVAKSKTRVQATIVTYQKAEKGKEAQRMESKEEREMPVYFLRENGQWLYATQKEWNVLTFQE